VELEVHDQKCHVGDRVGEAEPLVELDAVDRHEVVRRRAVREVVDVIEVQVAVRVPRHAAAGAVVD
jgi:hypothetical protein